MIFEILSKGWVQTLLLLNALLGGLFFLYIWKLTKRIRQSNPKLEEGAFSLFRRDHKRWKFSRLFCASITFALPRFILLWGIIFSCAIWLM